MQHSHRPRILLRAIFIAGAHHDHDIAQKGVFGPELSVTRCDGTEQVIDRANDSQYDLASPLWQGNPRPQGYGKDLSHYSLKNYSVVRHVMLSHKQQPIKKASKRCRLF
ncbi:aldehyde dehydrogenase family protein [Thalassolituus marinus]|uniref:Aldehyde dehydrogenase family protein n=1 Tax=Thalassolituus marinus TaxID=671053 RepID=A0ABS7ZPZ5_9GAMM|nr:aldehyde dehydrogenase family protein [Thalassolituus marinus]MCA6063684.1 aldehyde dehydrogenase family protein [Thalassolituus marinus]